MSDMQTPPDPGDRPAGSGGAQTGEPQYGAGMPNMPALPENPQGVTAVDRPPSIVNAVRVMYLGAAISLIGIIAGFATLGSAKDAIRQSLQNSGQSVTDAKVNAAYGVVVTTVIVVGVIGILLWLWMAWKNGQGRKWARVVATVLAVLNVIFTLLAFTGNSTTISAIISIVNLIVGVAAIILLYRPDASAYYDARSARPV